MTDPALIPLWTATGAGGRPEGFAASEGTRFRFIAKPKPGWNGVVNCEVLEVDPPSLLRYSWTGDEGGDVTEVSYGIEPLADLAVVLHQPARQVQPGPARTRHPR